MTDDDDPAAGDDNDTDDDDVSSGGELQLPDLSSLGLSGSGGLPDLGGMMDGLAKMQAIQAEVFEGSAGGGLVLIRANGRLDVQSVIIRPEALEDGDADLLADLVLAALHDLTARVAAAQQEAMGGLGGLLGG